MVLDKLTLVELRIDDVHVGGGMPDDETPVETGHVDDADDAGARRSVAGRARRLALAAVVVSVVASVGAVAVSRALGGDDDGEDSEIELEGEDDVELTA